jgi:hypothetical protein
MHYFERWDAHNKVRLAPVACWSFACTLLCSGCCACAAWNHVSHWVHMRSWKICNARRDSAAYEQLCPTSKSFLICVW